MYVKRTFTFFRDTTYALTFNTNTGSSLLSHMESWALHTKSPWMLKYEEHVEHNSENRMKGALDKNIA